MINRIYVDNYKCFTNFECRFGPMQLLLGENGSGKTSTFNVLETLRDFLINGYPTSYQFPNSTLTAWDSRPLQTFELGLTGNGGDYLYKLIIEHDRTNFSNRIKSEDLSFNNSQLFHFDGRDAHLFSEGQANDSKFPFDNTRSAIFFIPPREEHEKLIWFRQRMRGIYFFSPDPTHMTSIADTERFISDRPMLQLASWIRHLWQQRADFAAALLDHLREIIEGLATFNLEKTSEISRELRFQFHLGGTTAASLSRQYSLKFDQLSDGQKNLVALYTILLAAVHEGATVCLDEPDNFISLREIQPWLIELRKQVHSQSSQCLLISHHPELINLLSTDCGLNFYREEAGPTRVKAFEWTGEEGLLPAELIARGWK